jgi:hypothetical protein
VSDTTRSAPATGAATGEPEDPLAADRRTLVIGAVAMVVLVGVGVVSAQVFVQGGCGPVGQPAPVEGEVVDPAVVVGDDQLAALEAVVGSPFTAAVEVPADATGLTPGADGLVVTGPTTTALAADLTPTTEITTGGTVAGSGDTVWDLSLVNDLTGQVDGFTPIGTAGLDPGSCTDTAVVGEDFAFLLDARDGRLLQFRSEEDGDGSRAELRDADGIVADVPVPTPAGSPGVLAERITGAVGPDAIVVARRAAPDDPDPVVRVAGLDGEPTLDLDVATLVDAFDLDPEVATRVAVHSVGDDTAVLSAWPDPARDADAVADADAVFGVLDLDDGDIDRRTALDGEVAAAAQTDDLHLVALAVDGRTVTVTLGDGVAGVVDGLTGAPTGVTWHDGDAMVATANELARTDADGNGVARPPAEAALPVHAVTSTGDGRLAVLLGGDDGRVVLATDPADAPG